MSALNIKNIEGNGILHHILDGEHDIAFQYQIMDALLKQGCDPNLQNARGETALHIVTGRYDDAFVECLLKAGADPNISDNYGRVPHCDAHYPQLIELLVSYGDDINHQDNNGNTALHEAIELQENFVWVRCLIDHGADLYIKNNRGFTPKDYMSKERWLNRNGILRDGWEEMNSYIEFVETSIIKIPEE
jgi:ankyrin repeat protein